MLHLLVQKIRPSKPPQAHGAAGAGKPVFPDMQAACDQKAVFYASNNSKDMLEEIKYKLKKLEYYGEITETVDISDIVLKYAPQNTDMHRITHYMESLQFRMWDKGSDFYLANPDKKSVTVYSKRMQNGLGNKISILVYVEFSENKKIRQLKASVLYFSMPCGQQNTQ